MDSVTPFHVPIEVDPYRIVNHVSSRILDDYVEYCEEVYRKTATFENVPTITPDDFLKSVASNLGGLEIPAEHMNPIYSALHAKVCSMKVAMDILNSVLSDFLWGTAAMPQARLIVNPPPVLEKITARDVVTLDHVCLVPLAGECQYIEEKDNASLPDMLAAVMSWDGYFLTLPARVDLTAICHRIEAAHNRLTPVPKPTVQYKQMVGRFH